MQISEKHFQTLLQCVQDIQNSSERVKNGVWIGKSTRQWLNAVNKGKWGEEIGLDPLSFSGQCYDRSQLRSLIHDQITNSFSLDDTFVRSCVANIFAWGGQGARSARSSLRLRNWSNWRQPCFDLLNNSIGTADAYKAFYSLQNKKEMKGVGPAFYTKLIFFLGNGDGLIMDQWTSRSVNLLFDREVIRLNKGKKKSNGDHYYSVCKRNDERVYIIYNDAVSQLSEKLSSTIGIDIGTSETEEFIFSFTTDRKKTKQLNDEEFYHATNWRRYVEEVHRP
jgi:hypothetical protein